MVNILDMQDLRYLNLFKKVTGVSTRYCFKYNDTIIFAVPMALVSRSVGEKGKNVKRISEITKKRIRIIASPGGDSDIQRFISAVINPVGFNKFEIIGNEIIITGGSQNKAALLGRNKRRLLELQEIARGFFRKNLRII